MANSPPSYSITRSSPNGFTVRVSNIDTVDALINRLQEAAAAGCNWQSDCPCSICQPVSPPLPAKPAKPACDVCKPGCNSKICGCITCHFACGYDYHSQADLRHPLPQCQRLP